MKWHPLAREMDAAGATKEAIAEAVGRSVNTVKNFLVPGVRAGTRTRMARRYHRRMQDAVWREKQRQRYRAYKTRMKSNS